MSLLSATVCGCPCCRACRLSEQAFRDGWGRPLLRQAAPISRPGSSHKSTTQRSDISLSMSRGWCGFLWSEVGLSFATAFWHGDADCYRIMLAQFLGDRWQCGVGFPVGADTLRLWSARAICWRKPARAMCVAVLIQNSEIAAKHEGLSVNCEIAVLELRPGLERRKRRGCRHTPPVVRSGHWLAGSPLGLCVGLY